MMMTFIMTVFEYNDDYICISPAEGELGALCNRTPRAKYTRLAIIMMIMVAIMIMMDKYTCLAIIMMVAIMIMMVQQCWYR